jgi:hypothetical protein
MALLALGLLAISYGGCGGGSDDTSGGGTTPPTPSPTGTPTAPPTNPPGACEGDAFSTSATTSTNAIDCLTEFFVQNAETSGLDCYCNATEAGNFLLTISPSFESFMKINIEFPENTDPDILVITKFTFDWTAPGCNTLELFTSPLFSDEDLVSIGTFDNMSETAPDQLTFTANVSDGALATMFGSSGQMVSCDFCSIGNLPDCAPDL